MNCPICLSESIKMKNEKYDDRYACPGIFQIGICSSCGHHFVLDANGIDIGKLYTEFYPRKNYRDTYKTPLFEKKKKFWEWLNGNNNSVYKNVPRNVKVLDIGCGDCRSLFYYKERGCDVTGIEADENVAFLKENFGDKLVIGEFGLGLFGKESFDYVTLDQVVEHFDKPIEKLLTVNDALKKGGKIVLTTPNSSGWGVKIFGKYWINWHTPYHLNLFSKKSIEIALESAGYKIIKIKTSTSPEWLSYQWSHIVFYPEEKNPSFFWSDKEIKISIKVKIGRKKFDRYIYNLLHRTKINHIITRIFDCLGMGDNLLVIAEKK